MGWDAEVAHIIVFGGGDENQSGWHMKVQMFFNIATVCFDEITMDI